MFAATAIRRFDKRRIYKILLQGPLRAAIYGAFVVCVAVFKCLGLPLSRRIGRGIGAIAGAILPYERRIAAENLAQALPELDESKRRQIRAQAFRHFGQSGAELLHVERALNTVDLHGGEALKAATQQGGAIVVSGHIGNWELLGAAVARAGVPLTVIAKRIYDPRFDRWMRQWRDSFGTETIVRGGADTGKRMQAALQQNRALVMLIDQDTDVPSVWTDFFGRPAKTPSAPATYALRGLPVFMATIVREPDNRHRAQVRRLDHLPADIEGVTAKLNQELEAEIRKAPAQWVWFHRRWKSPPP